MNPVATIEEQEFTDFCQTAFESLPRSDQRRCAQVYVRGLMNCSGRRSSQRIAAEVPGPHNGQSLQQFVNQSPWDPQPMRCRVADLVLAQNEPAAWVLEQVVFPKNGRCSAAVERQYVRTLGRVANCQVSATMTLTSPEVSVPVNWRLCLPESWDADDRRRARAHIPPHERHRPYWRYLVDLVDDMTLNWDVPAAPIVSDVSHCPGGEELLTQLENRDLGYLVQVHGGHNARSSFSRGAGAPRDQVGELRGIVRMAAHVDRHTVVWYDACRRREVRSQFFMLPVGAVHAGSRAQLGRTVRHVLVEWPLGRDRPRALWLTNLVGWSLPDLVALSRLRERAQDTIAELSKSFGLYHHEGRSFLGWHHHVTLVSVAYVFHVRARLGPGGDSNRKRDGIDRPIAGSHGRIHRNC